MQLAIFFHWVVSLRTISFKVHKNFVTGAIHEHNRQDRDLFITVHKDRINEEALNNFDQKDHYVTNETPYDFCSVMHYNGTRGRKTGTDPHCMTANHPFNKIEKFTGSP